MSPTTTSNVNHDDSDAATMSSWKGESHSAKNPACDLCREKKVRCGREKPACRNCIGWKTSCTYSERQKRDNEESRSVQRFEEVHDRLDRIESTMLRLVTALETANARPPATQTVPEPIFRRPTLPDPSSCAGRSTACGSGAGGEYSLRLPNPPQARRDVQYLGPSSIFSLSIEAGSLAEETLRQNSVSPRRGTGNSGSGGGGGGGGGAGPGAGSTDARLGSLEGTPEPSEQVDTIGALKKLSSVSSNVARWFPYYGHKELRIGAGGASMKIPERGEAEELAREYFQKVHVWIPIFDEAFFMENMAKFYAGDPELANDRAWLVCFNNVLLFGLFNRNTGGDLSGYGAGKNFFLNAWAAIDDLEVFLGPRLRNIQALMTGAVIANEISRPGLCWSLVAQAARSAQAIGLHRSSNDSHLTKSEIQERRCLFWNIYVLDKCLSLSFGRSTCLPDFDCDVELPEDNGSSPYFKNFIALILLAKIQSKIYVRLYSASAARLTDEKRARVITELDGELRRWWEEKKPIFFNADGTAADSPRSADGTGEKPLDIFSRMELQFSYLCSLTLVHRTARPGMLGWAESESISLESSRQSIRIINQMVENNLDIANSGMIMWLFQYYPFTAFFILFSAIIRNPSAPTSKSVDFPLMKSLVCYLSRMKEKNDGAAKLLQVASAFTHVAGTFLKNYGKIEQQREHAGKRRRREMETGDDNVDPRSEPEEAWLQEGGRDGEKAPVKEAGKCFYGTTTFRRDEFGHVLATAVPTHAVYEHEPSMSASMSTTSMEEDGFGEVDLHLASFLKWPEQDGQGLPMDMGVDECVGTGPPFDMDLQALMAEPEGFQMQMEQAVLRGPLEFDWLSWEGSAVS